MIFVKGLSAIISVKVPEPQFEGQTKTKLGNNEVMGVVDSTVSKHWKPILKRIRETLKTLSIK